MKFSPLAPQPLEPRWPRCPSASSEMGLRPNRKRGSVVWKHQCSILHSSLVSFAPVACAKTSFDIHECRELNFFDLSTEAARAAAEQANSPTPEHPKPCTICFTNRNPTSMTPRKGVLLFPCSPQEVHISHCSAGCCFPWQFSLRQEPSLDWPLSGPNCSVQLDGRGAMAIMAQTSCSSAKRQSVLNKAEKND